MTKEYKYNTSQEMLDFMLLSHPFQSKMYTLYEENYIGNHHRLEKDEDYLSISREVSKKLFYKDIEIIEKYAYIKDLKKNNNQFLYDIAVHFTFDYGKNVLKNSRMFLYLKTQNISKVIDELRRYQTFRNTLNKGNTLRRNFDIKLLENNSYQEPVREYGTKQRIVKKHVGFSY